MIDVEAKLKSLVSPTPSRSRADWKEIVLRTPVGPTERQVRFTPTEVILSLAASLLVNHKDYSGHTAHLAPSPISDLAQLFKRRPTSVLAKMANLDGTRRNGGKAEKEAASILLAGGAAGLFEAYTVVMAAARAEGITENVLPDFLGAEQSDFIWLGQEELNDGEIAEVVAPDIQALRDATGLSETATERLLIAAVRVKQHDFARGVVGNCANRCVFCGIEPGPTLAKNGLIRASHIKPWRDSNPTERLDTANGLAACPNHDAAFDRGLIYLTDDLEIHAASRLADRVEADSRVRHAFGKPPIGDRLLLPVGAVTPKAVYLKWHREHVGAA